MDQTEERDDGAWRDWCDRFDRAQGDVHTMFYDRYLWKNVMAMLEQNVDRHHARVVKSWIIRSYIDRQCSAIRRLNDDDRRTASLRRCLSELIEKPMMLTWSRYEQLVIRRAATNGWEDDVLHGRGSGYAEFADASGDHLDVACVRSDLDILGTATASVKAYTDKRIAHLDHKADLGDLTFGDIDNAVVKVGELTLKYYKLRHPGENLAFLTPVPEPWLMVFKDPWWPSGVEPIPAVTLG